LGNDKQLEEELAEYGRIVDRLRITYNQFFLGVEKRPPWMVREQLEKRLRNSELNDTRRAGLKFRFQTLLQKYRTHEVYWDRVLREIEEGRFNRDEYRRNMGYGAGRPLTSAELSTTDPSARAAAARPAQERTEGDDPEPPAKIRIAEPPPAPDVATDPVRQLYRSYVDACKAIGLPVEGVTETAFRAGIEKQRRIQSERLGVADVSFQVSVKEGKVVLLARPLAAREGQG
jgi:hypothetical protein